MGLKHGKYVYVKRSDGYYIKVRVLKSRGDEDQDKYIVVGPKTHKVPPTATIVREEQLPEKIREKLYAI